MCCQALRPHVQTGLPDPRGSGGHGGGRDDLHCPVRACGGRELSVRRRAHHSRHRTQTRRRAHMGKGAVATAHGPERARRRFRGSRMCPRCTQFAPRLSCLLAERLRNRLRDPDRSQGPICPANVGDAEREARGAKRGGADAERVVCQVRWRRRWRAQGRKTIAGRLQQQPGAGCTYLFFASLLSRVVASRLVLGRHVIQS